VFFFKRARPNSAEVATAIRRGLERLAGLQMEDGSFPMARRQDSGEPRDCHALFSTLTVCLAVGAHLPQASIARAVSFVERNRRPDGLWSFDPKADLPPDSDCTACALALLARHPTMSSAGEAAASLRAFWRSPDGPFRTWMHAPDAWSRPDRDDAVVNFNVLLALKELESPASPAEVEASIALANYSRKGTRYYCSYTTITYAASRAGVDLSRLHASLLARPAMRRNLVLPAAQWLSAMGSSDTRALRHLLAMQEADGAWPAEAWCRDVGSGRWESAAISTALCVEALDKAGPRPG